jgi:hypothetical protein
MTTRLESRVARLEEAAGDMQYLTFGQFLQAVEIDRRLADGTISVEDAAARWAKIPNKPLAPALSELINSLTAPHGA